MKRASSATTLSGELYFRVSDVLLRPDALGSRFRVGSIAGTADILFPASNDDTNFNLTERTELIERFDDHVWTEDLVVDDHDDTQAVRTVRVDVQLAHVGDDASAWERAESVARAALGTVISWIRVETGQAGLKVGELVATDSRLRHEQTRIQLAHKRSFGSMISLWLPPDPRRLDSEGAQEIARKLNRLPETADALLADADEALWYATPSEVGKALVLMGAALELRARDTARRLGLVPARDIAKAGFNRLMTDGARFYGRSLAAEDPVAFRKVTAGYRARNVYAHEGLAVDPQDAALHLEAAHACFGWLRSL